MKKAVLAKEEDEGKVAFVCKHSVDSSTVKSKYSL